MDIAAVDPEQISHARLALGALAGVVIHVGWFWYLAFRTGVLRAFGGIPLGWDSLGALCLLACMPIVFLGAWALAPVQLPGFEEMTSTLLVMSGTTTLGVFVMSEIAKRIRTPDAAEVRRRREEMETQRWDS